MVEDAIMSSAGSILARIREALQRSSHSAGAAACAADAGPAETESRDVRRLLPAVGSTPAEQLALFQRNAHELKVDFKLVPGVPEAAAVLAELGQAEQWRRVAVHGGALTDAVGATLPFERVRVDAGLEASALAACDAGLTECDALVAQTGTVVVTSRSAGGRALSCLPPHHVVLARRAQLVAGLPEALDLLQTRYGRDYPSMISFITGPSRTGDIERILVLGAHGPRKLTVLCW